MSKRIETKLCIICRRYIKGSSDHLNAHYDNCIPKKIDLLRATIPAGELLAVPELGGRFMRQPSATNGNVESNLHNDAVNLAPINETGPAYRMEAIDQEDYMDLDEELVYDTVVEEHEAFGIETVPEAIRNADDAKVYDMHNVHIPEEDKVKASIDLYALTVEFGASREFFGRMVKIVNNYTDGLLPPLLSYHRSRNALRRSYPIQPKIYDVCRSGCKMYQAGEDSLACTHCQEPRFKADLCTPAMTMQQLSLKEQLALLISNDQTRNLLRYRSSRESSPSVMKDIFDGNVYKEMKNLMFENELDLALGLYTDDFQPFKRGQYSMTIVHVVLLNLPPEKRTEDKYMLQVCVTPGPNKPADIFSFLEPFLTEVRELSESGMIVRIGSGTLKVKGHLMFVGGDIPAVAKMCGHAGHNHYHGCRFCTIRGVYTENRMTFPPVFKNGRDEAQADHRPKASIRLSQTFQISDQCLGQQKASPFATLSSFHGATFFPVDPMHLLGPGIGKQLWRLILGDYGESANPFYLSPKNRQLIGARIAASRSLIPSSFAGDCGDVATQSGFYRAVDWIHFVRFFVPTIVLEFYTDPGVRKAIIDLSEIYCYALSRELSVDQIRSLKATVFSWTAWLHEQVRSKKIAAAVFTVNQHYLSHLYKIIERLGPLPFTAAFAMERAIGELKRRIHSKRHTGANAGNVFVELSAVRGRKRLEDNDDNDNDLSDVPASNTRKRNVIALSDVANGPEIWSPFAQQSIAELQCKSQLRNFWAWQCQSYDGIQIDENEIVETGSYLFSNGRVFGGITRESFVYLHVWVDTDRSARHGSIRQAQRKYFGDLKLFFCHTFQGREKMLALVEVCKTVKVDGCCWPYKTESGGSKLVIVGVECVVGPVGRAKGSGTREHLYWTQKTEEIPIDYELSYIR